jgi:hypothetical protein
MAELTFQEAKDRLDTAIRDYVAATRDEGEYVTDWFLVASTAIPAKADTFGYLTAASNIPYHSAIGLLEVARQRVDNEAYEDTDERRD